MQYYIYGCGGNGRVIAKIIETLNAKLGLKDSYVFIDDAKDHQSLEALHQSILKDKESLILISSLTHKEEMAKKCLEYGLKNYCNGVEYFGKRLNAYYAFNAKNIAFLVDDLGLKHFGNIAPLLAQRDYRVFYFCLEHRAKISTLDTERTLLITIDFLPYLSFCPLVLGTSMQYCFDASVKYLRLMPSYDIPFDHSYFHTPASLIYRLLCYDVLSKMGSYFVAQNKKAYTKIYQNLDSNSHHLLPLGYPSLDRLVKEYAEASVVVGGGQIDTIICNCRWKNALNGVAMRERMCEVVDLFLERGYRVCYKSNPNYDFTLQAEVAKRWQGHPNFVFFTQEELSVEELRRSITLVDFGSSPLYTYPLITHKPSVILQPDFEWFKPHCHIADHFYEERLHLKAFCNTDLLEIVARLKSDLDFKEERARMIEHYIANETYHFGCASEAVVEFIEEYYKKWVCNEDFKY